MNKVKKSLLILTVLTIFSGLVYWLISNSDYTLIKTLYLAFFYMPIPLYTLIILSLFEKENLVRTSISLKPLKFTWKSIFIPIVVLLVWLTTLLLLGQVTHWLFPQFFGGLITENSQLLTKVVELTGITNTDNVNMPPTSLLLIPITLISAVIAGYTINLVFAFGEEIYWRGFLWRSFEKFGFLKASLLIGFIWGLWHAPVILQGYNYGNSNPLVGVLMFILFCMSFSPLFSIVILKTNNVFLAAALHGMFNGFAGIFVILLTSYNPFIDGAIGITSILACIIATIILLKLKYFSLPHNNDKNN